MPPVLEIHAARRAFGDRQALDGASLTVEAGEWVGLLGPNGAGKTTLIRSVLGRVRLDEGRIQVAGTQVAGPATDDAPAPASGDDLTDIRRRIGLVPQELAIHPSLTARENLEIFGRLHGLDRAAAIERTAWALEFTGLAERADDVAQGYSGGMKRRLNIACGILHRPELVLLDEPTVGVDPQSRERIWTMLGELRATGTALLLTTHQLDEAQQVCDRIIVIDGGRTIAGGTMDELVDQTVGRARTVTVRVSGLEAPAIATIATEVPGTEATVTGELVLRTEQVAADLPKLLARVAAAGGQADDVAVAAPTLQSVFLHLTGRELRE